MNNKHQKIYNVLLMALLALTILAILTRIFLMDLWTLQPKPNAVFQAAVLKYVLALDIFFLIFCGVTLIARYQNKSFSKPLTKILNLFLLIYIPFGTVVGIYGLLKVDKVAPS